MPEQLVFVSGWNVIKFQGEIYGREFFVQNQVNGEIYNHEELRKSLSNHKFRTGSDCEVIAHLVCPLKFHILYFYWFLVCRINNESYIYIYTYFFFSFHKKYEEHGDNFVDMLDGMFSFVLLDTHDNSFIVARDAIGITSLYVGWGLDGSISF